MLPSIGRGVVHHGRDGIPALEEAETSAVAVLDIVRELKKRTNEF